MQDFNYTLRNATIFLTVVLVLTLFFPIYYLFISTNYDTYENDQRDALAGTVDTIASGASHIMYCFDPDIYDQQMGTVSYNLGGSLISMRGRYALLTAELERNPVKTVILELSYNSLSRGPEDDVEGDMYLIPRFPKITQRLHYLLWGFPRDKYAAGYSFAFLNGLQQMLFTPDPHPNKGMLYSEPVDLTVQEEEYGQLYHSDSLNTQILQENLYYLNKIFKLCNERDIRVIMVTVPIAQRFIVNNSGFDVVYQQLSDIAAKQNCLFVDFNLHKEKQTLYPDNTAYTNATHMCSASGSEFTAHLARTIRAYDNGEDIFSEFYNSYADIPPLY